MAMSPVGLTSRWIAATRALETESGTPLFSDPFARDLAGDDGFAMMEEVRAAIGVARFTGPDPYLSIRTRFFDDSLLAAVRDQDLRQVVLLAAGMDTRAFRLPWPDSVVLFEVDRPEVFTHKEAILERMGARPRCDRRIVRADVAADWTSPLIAAGFDPSRPAAVLVEGLLFYLDEAIALRLLQTLEGITRDGSWIALDAVNPEMLASPYFSGYMAKLKELGCPWKFAISNPEQLLAGHGWQVRAIGPGEPDADFGRWPYPVLGRNIPNLPRTFLVKGQRVTGRPIPVASDAAPAPAPAPTPIRYQLIREPDLVGSFAAPPGVGPFPGVLALGGSDGGLPEYFTDLLVPEGFACLALGYFGIDDLPAGLVEVPLERIERGLRWLAAHPRVAPRDGRVAIIGVSRGAELALLVASTFPDLVGPVAVYTPSHVVWPGVDYTAQPGAVTPSWTHRGQPLACMTYRAGAAPTFSERGVALVALSDQALDDPAAIERAAIPIERAAGPLLLISGGDDHVWAAERMCRMAVERMRTHGRGDAVVHLCYPAAGHALFPYTGPSGTVPQQVMRLDFGGSLDAGRAAHADAWPRVVTLLRGSLG
ncbi:MAG TPA: SAM-dependent methyltransferase [Vicinamibacterales bacterium]|nr:SAM-dependent methyltransferase [Vicinamibacterales bacterium]